jgi:hypothetical protein
LIAYVCIFCDTEGYVIAHESLTYVQYGASRKKEIDGSLKRGVFELMREEEVPHVVYTVSSTHNLLMKSRIQGP